MPAPWSDDCGNSVLHRQCSRRAPALRCDNSVTVSRRRMESVSTGAALIDLDNASTWTRRVEVLSTRPFLFTLPITTISLPSQERSGVMPLNLELRRVLSRRAHTTSACSAVTLPEKAALTLGDPDLGVIGLFNGLLCVRGRPSLFSMWSSSMRVPWRMAGRRWMPTLTAQQFFLLHAPSWRFRERTQPAM